MIADLVPLMSLSGTFGPTIHRSLSPLPPEPLLSRPFISIRIRSEYQTLLRCCLTRGWSIRTDQSLGSMQFANHLQLQAIAMMAEAHSMVTLLHIQEIRNSRTLIASTTTLVRSCYANSSTRVRQAKKTSSHRPSNGATCQAIRGV